MSAARPARVTHYVVAVHHGWFWLDTGLPPDADDDRPVREQEPLAPDDVGDLLAEALAGEGIAQGRQVVVVRCPHPGGLQIAVRLELWPAAPAEDGSGWDEVFEVVLDLGPEGLTLSVPTLWDTRLDAPPGRHRVRLSARRLERQRRQPGSATRDEWRLQLWPTTHRDRPRRLAAGRHLDPPT